MSGAAEPVISQPVDVIRHVIRPPAATGGGRFPSMGWSTNSCLATAPHAEIDPGRRLR